MRKKISEFYVSRLPIVFSVLLFLLTVTPQALADQVTLSYFDVNANAQTIVLDCTTPRQDLALATSLIGQEGVIIENDKNAGCGTLPQIAAGVASEAPLFAPEIAEAFASVSYYDSEMIAYAINKVPGVNTVAVQLAVNLDRDLSTAGHHESIGMRESSASLNHRRERCASRN